MSSLLDDVNVQPTGARTPTNVWPPAAVALIVDGFNVNVHVVPYCVTVNGTPLTRMLPVRSVLVGFGATV